MSSTVFPERPSTGRSLSARLTAWYAASAFLTIAGVTALLSWTLIRSVEREVGRFIAERVHVVQVILAERPKDRAELKDEVEWEWRQSPHARFFVRVLDEKGRSITETPGMAAAGLAIWRFPDPVPFESAWGPGARVLSEAGTDYQVVAVTVIVENEPWVIQAGADRTAMNEVIREYLGSAFVVLTIAVALSLTAGYVVARRGLTPLSRMADSIALVRSTNLDARLDQRGLPPELDAVAASFNELLERLEEAFARLSRFSADIAHELRTPLNNIRGEAEVALSRERGPEDYRRVLESCLEEASELSRLIDALLFLARADSAEARIQRSRFSVAREVAAIAEFYEAAAKEAGITLAVDTDADDMGDLDRTLFQRAIGNLIENALRYTPRGGTITISTKCDAGQFRLAVTDTGSGIPSRHLPHLFDRFYRVDGARADASGGHGLGLAIVKSVVSLHGGEVEIASAIDRGTSVTLRFPAAHQALQPPA